jgi:hypothetical protein
MEKYIASLVLQYEISTEFKLSEISDSRGGEYEETVYWDAAPCSLVEVYRRFRGTFCLHHQGNRPGATSQKSSSEFKITIHNSALF